MKVPNKYAMMGATNQLLPQIYALNNSIWHNADTSSTRQNGTKYFSQCQSMKSSFIRPCFIFDFPTVPQAATLLVPFARLQRRCLFPLSVSPLLEWESSRRSLLDISLWAMTWAMNEKQRERPENINHGATYGNGRLSIPSDSAIKGGREGEKEGRKQMRESGGERWVMEDKKWKKRRKEERNREQMRSEGWRKSHVKTRISH